MLVAAAILWATTCWSVSSSRPGSGSALSATSPAEDRRDEVEDLPWLPHRRPHGKLERGTSFVVDATSAQLSVAKGREAGNGRRQRWWQQSRHSRSDDVLLQVQQTPAQPAGVAGPTVAAPSMPASGLTPAQPGAGVVGSTAVASLTPTPAQPLVGTIGPTAPPSLATGLKAKIEGEASKLATEIKQGASEVEHMAERSAADIKQEIPTRLTSPQVASPAVPAVAASALPATVPAGNTPVAAAPVIPTATASNGVVASPQSPQAVTTMVAAPVIPTAATANAADASPQLPAATTAVAAPVIPTATAANAVVASPLSPPSATAAAVPAIPTASMANTVVASPQSPTAATAATSTGYTSQLIQDTLRSTALQNLCTERLQDALPFLDRSVERRLDMSRFACSVPVANASCVSAHPLWDCSFNPKGLGPDLGLCSCEFNTVCHGISSVLEPNFRKGLPLVCGPGEGGVCSCRGFLDCPQKPENGWQCVREETSGWGTRRVLLAAKMNSSGSDTYAEQLETELTKGGACHCFMSTIGVPVPLTNEELNKLFAHPLDVIGAIPKAEQKLRKEVSDTNNCQVGGGSKDVVVSKSVQGFMACATAFVIPLIVLVVELRFSLGILPFLPAQDTTAPRVPEPVRRDALPHGQEPLLLVAILMSSIVGLLRINFYVMLTTLHLVVEREHKGKDFATVKEDNTEVLIAAAQPLAGILAISLVGQLPAVKIHGIKELMLYCCTVVFVGSLLCLLGMEYDTALLLGAGRALAGIGELFIFVGPCYLARASSDQHRTKILAIWEAFNCLGTLMGLSLTSVLDNFTLGSIPAGVSGVRFVTVLSLFLAFIIYVLLPPTKELEDSKIVLPLLDRPSWLMDEFMTTDKWMVQAVNMGTTMGRSLHRLLWENTASLVFAVHFCMGHIRTGYSMCMVLTAALTGQIVLWQLSRLLSMTDHLVVRLTFVLEVAGLLIIYCVPSLSGGAASKVDEGIILFTLGSMTWYMGNALTAAPISAWGVKCKLRPECVFFYNALTVNVGSFVGCIVGRLFIASQKDADGTAVVVLLIPLMLAKVVLCEVGMLPEPHKEGSPSNPNAGA